MDLSTLAKSVHLRPAASFIISWSANSDLSRSVQSEGDDRRLTFGTRPGPERVDKKENKRRGGVRSASFSPVYMGGFRAAGPSENIAHLSIRHAQFIPNLLPDLERRRIRLLK